MLVTGTPPFDGPDDKAIMKSIANYSYSLKCNNKHIKPNNVQL